MKKTSKINRLISLVTALVTVFTFMVFVLPNGAVKASAAGIPDEIDVCIRPHIQNLGWGDVIHSGGTAGTVGQSLRLEKVEMWLEGWNGNGGVCLVSVVRDHEKPLEYAYTYWMEPSYSNMENSGYPAVTGTEGLSSSMDVIRVDLWGEKLCRDYNVYFKAHSQDLGWSSWIKGNRNVTAGQGGKRIEAIQVRVFRKGSLQDQIFSRISA